MTKNTAITIIIIAALVLLLILGYVWYNQMQYNAPVNTKPLINTPSTSSIPSSGNLETQKTYNIEITNFVFSPSTLAIKKGDTVIWTNKDSVTHTIISDSGSEISSGSLSNGQIYSHIFNTAGTYDYHCSIHPTMKASITVQ
jgi:plastocyanin